MRTSGSSLGFVGKCAEWFMCMTFLRGTENLWRSWNTDTLTLFSYFCTNKHKYQVKPVPVLDFTMFISFFKPYRRSLVLTKAGPWTAWFCAMKWQSGWKTTSQYLRRRVSMSMGCIWMEPAGTAETADSSTLSPKSYLKWCPWSGCSPRTMVRYAYLF